MTPTRFPLTALSRDAARTLRRDRLKITEPTCAAEQDMRWVTQRGCRP